MKILLDGRACYSHQQVASTYYEQFFKHLAGLPGLSLEWLSSGAGYLAGKALETGSLAPEVPRFSWISHRGVRRVLSPVRRALNDLYQKKKSQADGPYIFHSFLYGLPPGPGSIELPFLLDLIPEKFPHLYQQPAERELVQKKSQAMSRARRIIAISENTKKDAIQLLRLDPGKISVAPLGVDLEFFSTPSPRLSQLERPYFLQVGGRLKHKNFTRLLKAFAASGLQKDFDLVCAGELWSQDEEHLRRRLKLEREIVVLNYPSNEILRSLYQHSVALVYPSLYEGFGMPPLEAMASGTAVLASNTSSIPEVCANAALYFNPFDVEQISEGLKKVIENRDPLVQQGRRRAVQMTWAHTMSAVLEVLREVCLEIGEPLPARNSDALSTTVTR